MYKKITAYRRSVAPTSLCKPVLMRLCSSLLIICIHVSVFAFGQKVTINRSSVPLTTVIKEIKRQSGYNFLYDAGALFNTPPITVKAIDADLTEVLELCLDGLSLDYVIRDNYVIISKRVLPVPDAKGTQQRELSGRVTSSDGEHLEGVTVRVQNSTIVTSTDASGAYRVAAPSESLTLTFSLLGFESQQVVVGPAQMSVDVVMRPSISDLDEVVVVGFGERRRGDLTGSISTVTAADIGRIPQASPQFALQGHTTGVRVAPVSGNPNDAPQIFIRGVGTWNGSSQPLYVVDGQIFEPPREGNEDVIGSSALRTPPNIFNLINANDIESISVLKDASAAAIYGSRAANGVVLITTKRGKSERPIIELDVNMGIQSMPTFSMLNTEQYVQFVQEMYQNNRNPDVSIERNLYGRDEPNDAVRLTSFNPQFDPQSPYYISDRTTYKWQDELVEQNAFNQNHSLRVSGATDRVDYYVSGGYFDQDGAINGNNLKRLTGAINVNVKATDWAKIGVNYKYTNQRSVNFGGDLEQLAVAPPWQPIYDPNDPTGFERVIDPFLFGSQWQGLKKYGQGSIPNVRAQREYNTLHFDLDRNFAQLYLELKPLKGLMLRGSLNFDYTKQDRWQVDQYPIANYFSPAGQDPREVNPNAPNSQGRLGHRINNTFNYQSDFTATYDRVFASKHNLNLVVGVQDQRHRREILDITGGNLTNIPDNPRYIGFGGDLANNNGFYGWNHRFWFGMVGRASYHYDSRYYLDLSLRRDASNGFAKDYRWGKFFAASGAWRVSSEPFFNVDFVDDLKIHGGWGQAGNDEAAVGRYAFLSGVNTGSTTYRWGSGNGDAIGNMNLGAVVNDFPNPTLSWEVASTINIGFDALMLNNRLNVTAEWYKRRTNGILQTVSLPFSVGTNNPLFNIGELENKGVDLSVGYRDKAGDFSYGISGNISFLSNVVTKLYNDQPLLISGLHRRHGDNVVRVEEGRSIGAIWGYKVGGMFQTQQEIDEHFANTPDNSVTNVNHVAPGDLYFQDVQGNPTDEEPFYSTTPDGRVNDFDRTEIGNVLPGYTYGLNLNFGWKGLDLIMNFYGEGDVDRVNSSRRRLESMSGVHNQLATTLDRWTPTNTNTTVPRVSGSDPAGNNRISDRWVEDASFFRLNTWQLGYSLPASALNALRNRISSLRVFVGGHNNIYLHRWSTLDPINDTYPLPRSFTFGLNARF